MHLGEKEKKMWHVLLAVSILSFPLFYWLFYQLVIVKGCDSDISLHAQAVADMVSGKIGFQPNFLYYEAVYWLSGFSGEVGQLTLASILLVSLAKAATIYTSGSLFLTLAPNWPGTSLRPKHLAAFILLVLSFQLLHSISYKLWIPRYIGQFTPTLWHNSTTIVLIPIATLLFQYTYLQLQQHAARRLWAIGTLALVSCFIKPTFFIVLAPAYGLLVLFGTMPMRAKIASLAPLVAAVAVVGAMTVAIYVFNLGSQYKGESSVTIKPFFTWLYVLNHRWLLLPISLVLSILFPVAISGYFYFVKKEYTKLIHYITLVFTFALLIFILFLEQGPRMLHGNFGWQLHVASHIWFVVGAALLYRVWLEKKPLVFWALSSLYLLHLASGILYLRFYFTGCSYI